MRGAKTDMDDTGIFPDRRPKMAERIADELTQWIIDNHIVQGTSLGTEINLAERLGTSRWTVREAIGILEREGQATIRRGRYGGIFVTAPSVDAVSSAIRSYLEFIRVDVDEIIQARHVLDGAIIERAVANVTPADIPALRTVADLTSENEGVKGGFTQYAALLAVARSPALQAFVRAVGQLGTSAIIRSALDDNELEQVMQSIRLMRRQQIEAVIAGDLGAAMTTESAVLQSSSRLLHSARRFPDQDLNQARIRALRFLSKSGRFKRPELLMHEIASDIVAQGWPVGMHLGTEGELLTRYSVSRSAFREAVRSLEQIGVVEMKTGRLSGLKVGSPSPETIVAASCRQFGRMKISRSHLRDAFYVLGTSCAAEAATRKVDEAQLKAYARQSPATFFNHVAELSENRILSLMMQIITAPAMRALEPGDPNARAPQAEDLANIADAIIRGDGPIARRLVLHLQQRSRSDTPDGS
ncbi:DNA-binding transcriptional regulator, FadR family [Sphingobium faniae]|nr:DNA-binding transcriptional regulator, FadR family [Sphingobium faniae]